MWLTMFTVSSGCPVTQRQDGGVAECDPKPPAGDNVAGGWHRVGAGAQLEAEAGGGWVPTDRTVLPHRGVHTALRRSRGRGCAKPGAGQKGRPKHGLHTVAVSFRTPARGQGLLGVTPGK